MLRALFVVSLASGCLVSATAAPARSADVQLSISSSGGEGLAFAPDTAVVPPGAIVRIDFRNVSSQAHNLTFPSPISTGSRTIVEAGASDVFDLVAPGPGRYPFVCTIHVGMSGTMTVK
jgi:plastocyanin